MAPAAATRIQPSSAHRALDNADIGPAAASCGGNRHEHHRFVRIDDCLSPSGDPGRSQPAISRGVLGAVRLIRSSPQADPGGQSEQRHHSVNCPARSRTRTGPAGPGFEAPHYQIDGHHRLMSTSGVRFWEDASARVLGVYLGDHAGRVSLMAVSDVVRPVSTMLLATAGARWPCPRPALFRWSRWPPSFDRVPPLPGHQ
jgi:hypothetical protein